MPFIWTLFSEMLFTIAFKWARIQVFVLTLVHNRYRLDKPTLDSGKAY